MIAQSRTSWRTLGTAGSQLPSRSHRSRLHADTPTQLGRLPGHPGVFPPRPVATRLHEPTPFLLSKPELQQLSQKDQLCLLQAEPGPATTPASKPSPSLALLHYVLSLASLVPLVLMPSLPPLNLFFLTAVLYFVSHPDRNGFILTNKKEQREKALPPSPQQGAPFTLIEPRN